jgi:hypothetical protein
MSHRHLLRAPKPGARPDLVQLETRDLPSFYGNQVFPLDNPWNQKVTNAPVAANSSAIINRIVARHGGTAPRLHPDFGNPASDGALYGIPINVVDGSTAKVPVYFPPDGYEDESDVVQVPIPANAVIEGDGPTGPAPPGDRGDSHLLVYDKSANVLYELYQAVRPTETEFPYGGSNPSGQWGAYQISVWDLNKNSFRTLGWTSADAAGTPIMPGLVRPDEALPADKGGQGVITHAIRFTVQQTRREYVYPGSHFASSLTASDLPRMGERFRLKASFVIPSTWAPEARAVAQAMKDYGLIVADNGSDMYFQGTPSTQWNMSKMLQIQSVIRASDFEVVDLKPAVTGLSVTTGSPAGGTAVTINGYNFSGAAGNLHVWFGGAPATQVTVLSDTQVSVLSPAHAVGTVNVQVQSGSNKQDANNKTVFFGYGTSPVTTAAQFTFDNTIPPPPPPSNAPPTITDVSRRTVAVNGTTGAIPFTVGDVETPAGSLAVSARTSNPTLVPLSGILLQGTGANRSVTVTPRANQTGIATITLTVTDAGGLSTSDEFVVTVTGRTRMTATFAVGSGTGSSVKVLNPDGTESFGLTAFPGMTSGVRTAVADFNADGVDDLVVGTGPGATATVRVVSGANREDLFFATPFDDFAGGVFVAVGDLTGDGVPDLVVTPDEGGGPRARAYDGTGFVQIADFFGIEDTAFRGGARAAIGDITGDGVGDLVVGAGYGGGPRVAVWDGASRADGAFTRKPFGDRLVFEAALRNGTYVAVGDLNGDGFGELIVGGGPGGGPRVLACDGRALVETGTDVEAANFFAGNTDNRGGVRLAVKDLDGDGRADIVTGGGAGSGSRVTAYCGNQIVPGQVPPEHLALDIFPSSLAGVFVG